MVDALYVFAPMGPARKTECSGTFENSGPFSHELVGVISEYPVSFDKNGMEMARRDFPGSDVSFVTRPVKSADGYAGAAIYLAIWAESMDAAQKLPGFCPLFEYTGSFWMPPFVGNLAFEAGDCFESRVIKRADMPVGHVPPLYDESGVATYSLIPTGELITLVFFKDDPRHFYAVPDRPDFETNKEEFARRYRDTL